MQKNHKALVVFVKYPEPGKAKTRMYPHISHRSSVKLYRAMVEDLIFSLIKAKEYDTIIYYSPPEKGEAVQKWLCNATQYQAQRGGNLGEKLRNAFDETLSNGYELVVVIGSDCLDLTVIDINDAFDRLDQSDVVVGPTEDGGYYLIGSSRLIPELFENISWSTNEVFPQTIRKLRYLKIGYAELDSKYDIDTYEDIKRFWKNLHNKNGIHAPKLRVILKNIMAHS